MIEIDRIGMMSYNVRGEPMKIIEYISSTKISVLFLNTNNIVKTDYRHFKDGTVKDKMSKTIFGIACLGVGKHNTLKNKKEYSSWFNMLIRCYSDKFQYKDNYIGCSVCEEWLNFQNFCDWYNLNIWGNLEGIQVDKDILKKGNKIYSPKTCALVDQRINKLFTKSDKARGNTPIGVIYDKRSRRYISSGYVGQSKNSVFIKYCTTIEDAFMAYKQSKEKYIKQIADEYKEKYSDFPLELYNAMYNYVVEESD